MIFLQAVFSAVHMVSDFANQFVKMEDENAQLRKKLAESKTAAEQVGAANKLAEEAWQKNEDLMKELAQVKAELAEATKAAKLREQEKASGATQVWQRLQIATLCRAS